MAHSVSARVIWKVLVCVWLVASVGVARAACPAANQYNFNFSSQTTATLAYGSSYTYTATSTALGSQNFTVALSQNGLSSTTVGGQVRPNISNSHNGGGTSNALVIGGVLGSRTTDITSATRVMLATFIFPTAIRDLSLTVHDVDFTSNQFRDWFHVTGANGASTYTPTLTTPFSQANSTGPFTNASSSLTLGPNTTGGVTATVNQAIGTGVSDNNSTTGNVNISFAQPVTSVTLRYGNYPLTGTETTTGQQAYSVSQVSWCPMPSLTVLKSATPVITSGTDPLRFNIPGSDSLYTITVTNSNSSPVDGSSIVITDVLPTQMTFYNADIDTVTAGTQNYIFNPGTTGLTMPVAGVTYSNNGGSTYAYTPAAGYDLNMQAIRIIPAGSMPANSSFSVSFRSRIK